MEVRILLARLMNIKLKVDGESTIEELEQEIDYWSNEYQYACSIDDTDSKRLIQQAIKMMNLWLGTLLDELENGTSA